jgi:elongator complex protein 1
METSGNYRKAFLACRKHRMDLNLIVEHDGPAFLGALSTFVEQVEEVDYINLFLSNIGYATFETRVHGLI